MNTTESTGESITVRVLKYDGAEYRCWSARVARREGSLLVLDAEFESDIEHQLLGEIRRGTRTVEYYWLDRWYNIFRFLEGDGSTRLWYCNINTPPMVEGNVLSYVDLDIDILVHSDLSYQVLDLDEFERNAERFEYSEATQRHAQRGLDELISLIESRQFPFDVR
jgi:protein associated with RNAse G/E